MTQLTSTLATTRGSPAHRHAALLLRKLHAAERGRVVQQRRIAAARAALRRAIRARDKWLRELAAAVEVGAK